MHGSLKSTVVALAAALPLLAPAAPAAAPAAAATPIVAAYADPAFAGECHFHHFGEGEKPPLELAGSDPLCVEYSKRDITADNGGALRFALAEPARFAVAVPACRYWQVDHWSVQVGPGSTRLVGWDGSYWFDKRAGEAAARLANFTVAGQPADAERVATELRPYRPDLADTIAGATAPAAPAARGARVRLPLGLPCR
ncbi:hypothetical protein [Planosporangium mesophilum]|nr:hypothetical protein [Planosporangium mesophilum]NJC85780.1 hypothetical protein [Planosporangium mesophilum]